MLLENYRIKITIQSTEETIQTIISELTRKYNQQIVSYFVEKPLSSREVEVLKLITEGKSNSEIAEILNIAIFTAKAHVSNILKKLNVDDRVKAAVLAIRENLI